MFECAHGDVGGSGAARRRRDRRLRMHWGHEQLSLRMLRASMGHHSWQSRTSVGLQTDDGMPGTQFFDLADESVSELGGVLKSLQLSRASVTCLLGVLRSSSQLSRASVTCLLDVELGVEESFFGVKGVGDVLA